MRALVLSGGGANGAYEVGVLQRILGEKSVHYDVLVGTSVGALNAAFLSQFPRGEEAKASRYLTEIWESIRGSGDIYRKHYRGWLWHVPVLWKHNIYTSEPLRRRVYSSLDPSKSRVSGKELRVAAVNWDDGEVSYWSQEDPDLREGVLASSSFPVFFDDVQTRGFWWTDGGLREIAPLKQAIRLGADRIDVILTSPDSPQPSLRKSRPGKLKKLTRLLSTLLDEVTDNDIRLTRSINELVKVGHPPEGKRWVDVRVWRPTVDLGDSLDFSPSKNHRQMVQGYKDSFQFDWR